MLPDTAQHQSPENNTSNTQFGIFDYFEVVIKRKRLIFYVTLSAIIISIVFSLMLPNKYDSTVRILPPSQDNGIAGLMMGTLSGGAASIASDLFGKVSPADQFASILESDRISDAIINKFNLMAVYNVKYRLDMYKILDQLVDIQVGKKDGVISITVTDKLPQRAADIANAYVDELSKLSSEMSMSNGSKNKEFLEKRLTQARVDLANAEDNIKRFQSKNKAIDVTEQAKVTIASVAEMREQLVLQEVYLAGLMRKFTDNSQEVKDAKTSITKIKANIAQLEGNTKGGTIPAIGSMPEIGQEYVRLLRELKIRETLVELLTKQYELAKYSETKDISNINVIQYATPPDKKSKPKRSIIVIFSTIAGFWGAVFACFVLEYLKRLPSEERKRMREMARQLLSWRSTLNSDN